MLFWKGRLRQMMKRIVSTLLFTGALIEHEWFYCPGLVKMRRQSLFYTEFWNYVIIYPYNCLINV